MEIWCSGTQDDSTKKGEKDMKIKDIIRLLGGHLCHLHMLLRGAHTVCVTGLYEATYFAN